MAYTILLADDDQTTLMTNVAFLKDLGEGYNIIAAPDGEKAYELVLKKHPDLIVVDWMMPKMTGLDLLAKLKENEHTADIPVVMVTALETSKDLELAFKKGATDYLTKPVDKIELLSRCRAALKSYSYFKEIKRQQEELAAMNAQLSLAEKRLEELNNLKDVFFNVISDDLKQPLYSLTSFVNLLIKNINNFSKEEMRYVADNIKGSLFSLSSLLQNLMNWTNLEKKHMKAQKEQLVFADVVEKSLLEVEEMFDRKKVRIENNIDAEEVVWVDREIIELVMATFFESVSRFIVERGELSLSDERDGDIVHIKIAMPGFRLKDAQAQNLFLLNYYMEHGLNLFEKGAGLGFVLCKKLLEKTGGEIFLDYEPKSGASFEIMLPVHEY